MTIFFSLFLRHFAESTALHRKEGLRDPAQAVPAADSSVQHWPLARGPPHRGGARVSQAERDQAGTVVILLSSRQTVQARHRCWRAIHSELIIN